MVNNNYYEQLYANIFEKKEKFIMTQKFDNFAKTLSALNDMELAITELKQAKDSQKQKISGLKETAHKSIEKIDKIIKKLDEAQK